MLKTSRSAIVYFVFMSVLSGCAGWLPASGPNVGSVEKLQSDASIPVVEVNDGIARRLMAAQKRSAFADVLDDGKSLAPGYVVGPGDVLEVSVWEAPPATLFGAAASDLRAGAAAQVTAFPEQMVAANGGINVPFAGEVPVAGKSPQQIEAAIARRLAGKANQPQVLVRVTRNVTANVTVVGEVAQNLRMPLTAKGERLLDALAAAGGVRQPVGKTTIQVSRDGKVVAMAMDSLIQDPHQNVILRPGDVVTALYQPLSFTVLGATGKNDEINFEAQGITLAQAMGRIGGMQDTRADAKGVFIFRFEESAAFPDDAKSLPHTPDGKVPVVYQVNLADPRTFLVAQNFPIRNKDVLYVANAPAAELQKFLNIMTSSVYSINALRNF